MRTRTHSLVCSKVSRRWAPTHRLDVHTKTHDPNRTLPHLRKARVESPRRARLRRLRWPNVCPNRAKVPRRLCAARRRQVQLPLPGRRIIPRRRDPPRAHYNGARAQREHIDCNAPSHSTLHLRILYERATRAEPLDGSSATHIDQVDAQGILDAGGETESRYSCGQHVAR
jgi:hypothetical protein